MPEGVGSHHRCLNEVDVPIESNRHSIHLLDRGSKRSAVFLSSQNTGSGAFVPWP